ncbi:hypothetical protein LCGC14_0676940 [marine sediment metagenome]|uniref:Uncharacterized protein n=1 Tax=marine sediment metagenome TaxID=412755 RepID=A0A0F9QP78_9ZZZZ
MNKTQFDNLAKNTVVYIARDNEHVETGKVFTALGLHTFLTKQIEMHTRVNDMEFKEMMDYNDKVRLEVANATEKGNPQKEPIPFNANHAGLYN